MRLGESIRAEQKIGKIFDFPSAKEAIKNAVKGLKGGVGRQSFFQQTNPFLPTTPFCGFLALFFKKTRLPYLLRGNGLL